MNRYGSAATPVEVLAAWGQLPVAPRGPPGLEHLLGSASPAEWPKPVLFPEGRGAHQVGQLHHQHLPSARQDGHMRQPREELPRRQSKSGAEVGEILLKLIASELSRQSSAMSDCFSRQSTNFSRQTTLASAAEIEAERLSPIGQPTCYGFHIGATSQPVGIAPTRITSDATIGINTDLSPAGHATTGKHGEVAGEHQLNGATTLMVRNLPSDCTLEALLEEWPIDGTYDLLYLPLRSGGRCTLGYAFLNFVSEAEASAFISKWKLRRLAQYPRGRSLNIVISERQGLEANLEMLRGKFVSEKRSVAAEVAVIKGGRRVPLQEA